MPPTGNVVATAKRLSRQRRTSVDSLLPSTTFTRVFANNVIHDGDYSLLKYKRGITAAAAAQARIFSQPLPLTRLETPIRTTKVWDIPTLVWRNVKRCYEQEGAAKHFSHDLTLRETLDPPPGIYTVHFSFDRVSQDKFRVVQEVFYKHRDLTKVMFGVESKWKLPGSEKLDISPADIDIITDNFAQNHVDFMAPIRWSLKNSLKLLVDCGTLQPDVLEDCALRILEKYQIESPRWSVSEVHAELDQTDNGKPAALRVGASVKISSSALGAEFAALPGPHRVLVALGSNMGDRVWNIEQALQSMRQKGLRVKAASHLYETKAMYYEDQANFLNAVCEVETDLEPLRVLDNLQDIENSLGRVRTIDKGPRTLDLDILLYDFDVFNHERLQIPHKLMLEREFVLRPLADIIPEERLPPPHNQRSILRYLETLEASDSNDKALIVSKISDSMSLVTLDDPARRTSVMAVLNVTPDSFSDGGKHSDMNLNIIESTVRKFIADGATIIDVGGQSTRPNATLISWEEELERVLPVIQCIRSIPEAQNVAISIDTFYSKVAQGAITAGADIINDVSAGTLDPQMLPLVAKMQKTIILMHMRGTPQTMNKLTDYPDGVLQGVEQELLQRVAAAMEAGILPWRIVLDPGIGFAKTQLQNLDLLKNFDVLRHSPGLRNFPWLVGTSRKGFIGKITGVGKAEDRTWGTAAAVTASIAGGADVIRVHDVSEMVQVVKMADAMYRTIPEPLSIRTANTFQD